jgi:type VI secretion system protein ImpK
MSGSGSPFDPSGRSDRTIIRPNPAGRRPAPPQSAPAEPASQPGTVPPPPPPAAPPPFSAPPPPSASPPGAAVQDDWLNPRARPNSPYEAPREREQAVVLPREELTTPNENPLMRAAGPLLLLLGRLQTSLMRANAAHLMEQVAATIQDFEHEVRAAGVSAEQTRTAKYVVCAMADDVVQNIPGEDRHIWTQYSMLSRFFGERVGGVRFFEELDRAKADPTVNYWQLELQHACLAMGFQGIHRTSAGGAAALQQIQRNLYETLRRVKKPNPDLSPRWQGQSIPIQIRRSAIPVWAIGAGVGVLLLGIYLVLRGLLGGPSEAVAASLIGVHPTGEVGIQRRVFTAPPPPPPPPQAVDITKALGPPLTIETKGNLIVIRMANLALFAPGEATVQNEYKPLIAKIAAVVEKQPGAIKVVGHTDSAPIRTVRFPSNFVLSQERAKAVATMLRAGLTKPDRVEFEGKGADVPIATNDTPAGRAQNRRVEILVQRSQ